MAISEAERQHRSDRARRQHAEGKLGSVAVAKKAAARSVEVRRHKSPAQIAARLLEDHEREVRAALLDALRNGTPSVKLKAAETVIRAGLAGHQQRQAEVHRPAWASQTVGAVSKRRPRLPHPGFAAFLPPDWTYPVIVDT